MENIPRLKAQSPLGDLIATLTEEAFMVAEDENEVSALVADMLSGLLTYSGTWH
jgi:hypothetical protein